MIAHVAGVPVEEALMPLASSVTAAMLLVRGWVASRAARGDSPPDVPAPPPGRPH